MRFEGNTRGITRSDYEQFSRFLSCGCQRPQREPRRENTVSCPQNQTQGRPIAMVYGVKQEYCAIYDPEIGLENGTMFEELNKPFYKSGCRGKGKEGCL